MILLFHMNQPLEIFLYKKEKQNKGFLFLEDRISCKFTVSNQLTIPLNTFFKKRIPFSCSSVSNLILLTASSLEI